MRNFNFAIRAAGVAMLCLSASACVEDQEALIVTHAIPFNEGEACTADPTNTIHLAADVLDVSFDTGYTASFAVRNNLLLTGTDGTNTGTEASEMKLTEAIVTLSLPGNANIQGALDAMDSTFLTYSQPLATESFNGGDVISPFVFIPNSTVEQLRNQMAAAQAQRIQMEMSVQFRALRSSNASRTGVVESRSFELPIELCMGCLRQCASTVTSSDQELCSQAACDNGLLPAGGGVCGNAQSAPTNPQCCAGGDGDSQAFACSP